MVCLENLMYRCRYQTDTSVWINCILHFCKGKREWKWCPGASFSLFGSKQISVWQTSICLKPTSQTIHCICLCLTIVLYPTHDICLHVCSAPWDTKPGLLCRLDSTTRPRYAVSSEPWNNKSCDFCPAAEVMLEVMPEVMSAETALEKWWEVFFVIVYLII